MMKEIKRKKRSIKNAKISILWYIFFYCIKKKIIEFISKYIFIVKVRIFSFFPVKIVTDYASKAVG